MYVIDNPANIIPTADQDFPAPIKCNPQTDHNFFHDTEDYANDPEDFNISPAGFYTNVKEPV